MLINWSSPLFDSDLSDDYSAEDEINDQSNESNSTVTASGAASTDISDPDPDLKSGDGKRRQRLQTSGSSDDGLSLVNGRRLSAAQPISGDHRVGTIGYQVTYVGWSEDTMPGGGGCTRILDKFRFRIDLRDTSAHKVYLSEPETKNMLKIQNSRYGDFPKLLPVHLSVRARTLFEGPKPPRIQDAPYDARLDGQKTRNRRTQRVSEFGKKIVQNGAPSVRCKALKECVVSVPQTTSRPS